MNMPSLNELRIMQANLEQLVRNRCVRGEHCTFLCGCERCNLTAAAWNLESYIEREERDGPHADSMILDPHGCIEPVGPFCRWMHKEEWADEHIWRQLCQFVIMPWSPMCDQIWPF